LSAGCFTDGFSTPGPGARLRGGCLRRAEALRHTGRIVLAGLILLAASPVQAADIVLESIETDNLRLLYFDPSTTYLAPYAARAFENSMLSQKDRFGFEPDGQVTVLLKDFSDYGNAAAGAVPRNLLFVDVAPMSFAYETFTPSERMYTLMNHELVHITTMDMSAAPDRRWRRFFGGKVVPIAEHPETVLYSYLTAPRMSVPRWYLEGSAVFMETWMSGGLGRAQGAYDEMVFRAMVRDDAQFYDPLGLVAAGTKVDFQVGVNAYLYGSRFMSYLAYEYSPEMLIEWLSRREDSERYYAAQFKKVFGLPMDEAWDNWIDFEREFQAANLAAVRQYPVTPHRDLTERSLGSVSRAFVDPASGTLYAGVRYPGVVAHIAGLSLDDGAVERLTEIKGPMLYTVTSLAFDPGRRTLFYTTDNQTYRDLMALDLADGRSRLLLKDVRIGDLVFNPADRALWGVRNLNGLVTLVRIPYPYEQWEQIHTFDYGEVIYDLDISPDGALLSTSFGDLGGDQSLRIYRIDALLRDEPSPIATQTFGSALPEGFVFTPDGRYLVGSSYYTGVSNIFRFEWASGELEALTNAETGFFRPVPAADGSMIVFRFTGEGFRPAQLDAPVPREDLGTITFLGERIADRHPEVTEWRSGSPADVPLAELTRYEGQYQPLDNLGLESMYPMIQGYKDSVVAGFRTNFSDPSWFHRIGLEAGYTVIDNDNLRDSEDWHARMRYEHISGWWGDLKYNAADFYDLFGPTKVSRKGYSAEVGYDRFLLYDKPRTLELTTAVGYFGNLEKLPKFQEIDSSQSSLIEAEAGLEYRNVRSSLGHVDDEKGHIAGIYAHTYFADSDFNPALVGRYDFGIPLPFRHTSIWLRSAGGIADGDADDSLANFFFGGFGNNWVDHREVKRYRDVLRFPGYDIDDIGGRNFVRSMLELNLHPVRFERVGTPGFYLSWARPAVFATALRTELGDSDLRRTVTNIGAQVDFQFIVLSNMEMMFSVGYAQAFDDDNEDEDEFMLSLKILQ
jgi:hypothetical protein